MAVLFCVLFYISYQGRRGRTEVVVKREAGSCRVFLQARGGGSSIRSNNSPYIVFFFVFDGPYQYTTYV